MKLLLCFVAALALAVPVAALADGSHPPRDCYKSKCPPPTPTPGPTVTPEPTSTPTPEPTTTPEPEPTTTPEPEETPPPESVPGEQGPPGEQGEPGPPGEPGTTAPACVSNRTGQWRLLARTVRVRISNVRVSFEGNRLPIRRSTFNGRPVFKATIDMTGLRRGIYTGRVRYTITTRSTGRSRRWTKVHHWRVCYGNPKRGGREGHNAFTTTIL